MDHPTRVTDPRHPTRQPKTRDAEAALLADLARCEEAAMPLARLGQGDYARDVHAGPGMTLTSRTAAAPAPLGVRACPYCKLDMGWIQIRVPNGGGEDPGHVAMWYCHPCGHSEETGGGR